MARKPREQDLNEAIANNNEQLMQSLIPPKPVEPSTEQGEDKGNTQGTGEGEKGEKPEKGKKRRAKRDFLTMRSAYVDNAAYDKLETFARIKAKYSEPSKDKDEDERKISAGSLMNLAIKEFVQNHADEIQQWIEYDRQVQALTAGLKKPE